MLGAEVLDRRNAVIGAVADHLMTHRCGQRAGHLRREALRIDGQWALQHHPHHLPVAGGGVLTRPEWMQRTMDRRARRRRDAGQSRDVAQAERGQCGQLQAANGLGDVQQRVCPLVPVQRSVR